MKIVWDEPKRQANIAEHGMDFADVVFFGWERALITKAHTKRMKAIGRFADETAVVIYAELGTEAISIISFRPAKPKERNLI